MPGNCKRAFHSFVCPFEKVRTVIFGQCQFDEEGKFKAWVASANMIWKYIYPVLHIYSDNWKVLSYVQDVLEKLSNFTCETPFVKEFQQLLVECRFVGVEENNNASIER